MDIRRLGTVPCVGDLFPLVGCGLAQSDSRNCSFHFSPENFPFPLGGADCSPISFFGGSPGGGGGIFENRLVSLVGERLLPFAEGMSRLRPLRSKGFGCAFKTDGPARVVEASGERVLPMGKRFEGLLERFMFRPMGDVELGLAGKLRFQSPERNCGWLGSLL